jgi:hypothetical protein
MLDDLREQANESDFVMVEDNELEYNEAKLYRRRPQHFLGMTSFQRFVIAVMILLMVCVLGSFLLLVAEKLYLPFF